MAVVGYGNQGRAQALNLKRSGVDVIVGARSVGAAARRAADDGFEVLEIEAAIARGDVVALLLPDEVVVDVWKRSGPALRTGAAVVFAHGFALLYGGIEFAPTTDVVLVSPTAPGAELARVHERGEPLPAYLAVHRDATGAAWALAREYAVAIGCSPTHDTTVREETEVDLFGEQTVLCGGMNALVLAAFETLVAAGYTPEIAYLECVHQLKYLADLLHDRGMSGFREAISGTARYGDVTRGPRVIGSASRAEMARILEEIRSGAFAREWMDEVAAGGPRLARAVEAAARHPIENARRAAIGGGSAPSGGVQNRATLCPKTD